MTSCYFEIADESASAGNYLSSVTTGGPWSAELQHGGPPTALLVRAAERLAAAETGRSDLLALRSAAEFVGPVPVAALSTEARVVRAARSAVLIEAVLRVAGRDCLQARVWLVAHRDTAAIAPGLPVPVEPATGRPGSALFRFPCGESIEWRTMHGDIDQPGPAAAWARPRVDLIEGERVSGLQRAALIGDFASGVSSELAWDEWSFLNVDLDVHLSRPLLGDWLYMDAATTIGPSGSGLARATLADAWGPVGATLQSLVVAPARQPSDSAEG